MIIISCSFFSNSHCTSVSLSFACAVFVFVYFFHSDSISISIQGYVLQGISLIGCMVVTRAVNSSWCSILGTDALAADLPCP